jgi:putative tributyrin esterase
MALLTINHHTKTLGKHHTFKVILPEEDSQYDIKQEVPLLKSVLLLHGLSNDETIYTRYTNVERYANRAHVAVIMPSADHSFYTNMAHGHSYYDYILEVHDYAHQILPLSMKREDNFVAGHSMGGYGTVRLAFTESSRFQKACFMSSATNFQNLLDYDWFDFSGSAIVGDLKEVAGTSFDLKYLVKEALRKNVEIRELYMMCGTEDVLYPDNLAFKEFLEAQKVPLKFEDGPGDHDWNYWNKGIEKAMAWFVE